MILTFLVADIRNAKAKLEDKGITPSIEKIAKSLNMSTKKVLNATEAKSKVFSIDRPVCPSFNGLPGDTIHSYMADNHPGNDPWHGVDHGALKVKVQSWIDDNEADEFVGVGARFSPTLESKEKNADKSRIALADSPDCCTTPRNKLTGEIILVHRGKCSFTTKANVAEAARASAIITG